MSSSSHQLSLQDIAVIIAAKNEQSNIKDCIDSILVSTEGLAEIIVVNDGSTDQTGKILESFGPAISVITTAGEGPSVARNKAIHATQKPYVAFVDADCIVDPKWLQALMNEFSNVDLGYVSIGGSQQMHPNGTSWDLFHASFLAFLGFVSDYVHTGNKIREVKHNPTCNVLYKKNEIVQIGEFDRMLWPCEDLDLDIRLQKAGKKFLFTPNAVIYHHRPDSFAGFMKMMFRYGFGHAQLVKKYGITQKIQLIPLFLLLMGAFAFWEVARSWFASLGFIKYIIVYAFLVIRSKSLIHALIYGFYLIPTLIAWNFGFFTGLFQKMKITTK